MNTCTFSAAMLIAALLLPNVAASADTAKEACQKGKARLDKADFDAAIASFTEAVRLDPKLAEGYYGRGIAYRQKGEFDKALADFGEAIRLDPQNSNYNNLAWLQATCPDKNCRDGKKAVENAVRACELTGGRNWCFVCTLGEAYAENGEFEKAREAVEKALTLTSREADKEVCRTRMEVFKQDKPYREPPPQRKNAGGQN